ncbi:MAG TPA: hypothetical protein VMQ62_07500 [Dongiaceae bacterium]|nr:hypothetical protein [Dongiaceae bacterium]
MTTSKRFIPALVFAVALPAAPIPGGGDVAVVSAAGAPAAMTAPAGAPRPLIRKLHVRVWEPGAVAPNVSVTVPTLLITALVKTVSMTGLLDRALDAVETRGKHDGAETCPLKLRGRQIDALWSALAGNGPASLVEVSGGDGGRVEIRVD